MNAAAPKSGAPVPPGSEVRPAKSDLRDEVLQHDLEYWGDSFWKNEEAGERRVNFYITLVTAVMAGLAGLYQQMLDHPPGSGGTPEDVLHRVAVPALLGLTLVGLITFMRMIRRNAVTDGYKEYADAIRRFALGSRTFEGIYRPEPEQKASEWVGVLQRSGRSLLNGGLTVTMAGLNSLVIAVLVGIDAWHRHATAPKTQGGWAFAGAFLVQVMVSLVLGERDRAARRKRDEARQQHFGAAGS